MATMATALLVLLLAVPVVHGTKYTVGDSAGWATGVDYTAWVAAKNFTVGDSLVFNYGTNHKVDEVTQDDYNNCNSANALQSHGGTTVTIQLSKAGSMYFICPTPGHCSGGMKLQVSVVNSSSGTPPTTPTPPPSGSGSPGGSTASPPPPPPMKPSGAWTNICNMNVIGVSIVLATFLLAFTG